MMSEDDDCQTASFSFPNHRARGMYRDQIICILSFNFYCWIRAHCHCRAHKCVFRTEKWIAITMEQMSRRFCHRTKLLFGEILRRCQKNDSRISSVSNRTEYFADNAIDVRNASNCRNRFLRKIKEILCRHRRRKRSSIKRLQVFNLLRQWLCAICACIRNTCRKR